MSEQEFAALLFDELERLRKERQGLLGIYAELAGEEQLLQQRLRLMKELLELEGMHIDLPDFHVHKLTVC